MKVVLITGVAGFIGSFLAKRLLETTDWTIVGIDNCNAYYDTGIKLDRLRMLASEEGDKGSSIGLSDYQSDRFAFYCEDISNGEFVSQLFAHYKPSIVVNLAAQAGVRYSIDNPAAYAQSNLIGFLNILEGCRHNPVEHLVYASSSSVYGGNRKIPFSEEDRVDEPVSLYAATKKSNELMAHAYSKLYRIPATGLRFFTVYGPMGRPDMAYYDFANKLVAGETIRVFNMGDCKRDFTYIDDVVEALVRVMSKPPQIDMGNDGLPLPSHRIYNIGNSQPERLMDFINSLQYALVHEKVLPADFDLESHYELVPMQPGDVPVTYADVSALEKDFGYKPQVPLREGLLSFAKWYKSYYDL